jgi:hypothetical protein
MAATERLYQFPSSEEISRRLDSALEDPDVVRYINARLQKVAGRRMSAQEICAAIITSCVGLASVEPPTIVLSLTVPALIDTMVDNGEVATVAKALFAYFPDAVDIGRA